MTSRNWVKLFLTTLVIGGVTTAIGGFIIRWNEFMPYFTHLHILKILSTIIWLIGMGFLFSVISQMGFFAYLTVHRFGLGMFKSIFLWNAVQAVLIIFVLFDFVYFRYEAFAKKGESILPYLGLAFCLLLVGLLIAWFKAKQTNKEAFIPALFFILVVTIIEWVPAIKVNENSWLYLMVTALLACNIYQLLILPKLNVQSKQQREKFTNSQNKIDKKPSI